MSSSLDEVSLASDRLATSQEDLKVEQEKVASVSKKSAGSLKDFALGASGAATAGLACIVVLTGLGKRSLHLIGLICRCPLLLRELRMPSETSMRLHRPLKHACLDFAFIGKVFSLVIV
jgi:hypothetical protein